MDPKNENFNMFDLIAYRVKFVAHPRAGTQWCIYPSYDYTHCLVDSLEQISHSLCTLEFETRRASYYWLLEVARAWGPCCWELVPAAEWGAGGSMRLQDGIAAGSLPCAEPCIPACALASIGYCCLAACLHGALLLSCVQLAAWPV